MRFRDKITFFNGHFLQWAWGDCRLLSSGGSNLWLHTLPLRWVNAYLLFLLHTCAELHVHARTHTHTRTQSHTDAVREVVGVDSCWQFAVCGLTCSRCLPVWGSAVCWWTPSRNDFPVWREAPQSQTADCRRLVLHFIQRRIVRVNTSLSLICYPIPIQIMDLNDFLSINGISE